jgi:hypothetical protein
MLQNLLVGVVGGFILGAAVGLVYAAQHIFKANRVADKWRAYALASDRERDELQAALARERGDAWKAAEEAELLAILRDEPAARPVVRPVAQMRVHEGADKYPFAAAAGLVAPGEETVDRWPAYAETVAAGARDEQ